MFQAVLDGGLEDRLSLVMHGLSDIFSRSCTRRYSALTPLRRADAGYEGHGSFKDFIRGKVSVNLAEGDACRMVVRHFDQADRPVEVAAEKALHQAIIDFAERAKVA